MKNKTPIKLQVSKQEPARKMVAVIGAYNKAEVKVWQSIAERDAAAKQLKQQEANKKVALISARKKELLAARQTVSSLLQRLETTEGYLKTSRVQEALSTLIAISKDNGLEGVSNSLEFLSGLFYIYKHTGLNDKLLEVAEQCIKHLSFNPDNYDILYDIAIYHEQYGDPGTAKHIYKMFIDNMELAYKDVAERYKNI